MPKLKIGGKTFRAEPYAPVEWTIPDLNSALSGKLRRVDRVLHLGWDCKTQARSPKPTYPTAFPKVGANVFMHRDPIWLPHGDTARKHEMEDTRDFLNFMGFSGLDPFYADLNTLLGQRAPKFDVDTAIAALKPTARLRIRVKLKYLHFNITHEKRYWNSTIFLSLPDEVLIYTKKTHLCTEEGVVETMGADRAWTLQSVAPIRAVTEDEHTLRRTPRKREEAQNAWEIKRLKEKLKKLREELEAIKPVEREGEGD
ncbi:MAG: hypothetical protein AAF744_02070 [Pseudomonadota bacterium]